MTTKTEWQAARSEHKLLTEEDAGAYEGCHGYAYEAGFILVHGGDVFFRVPLPTSEHQFKTLAEAEDFLWAEWCGPEING